jgi:hypothetical protein
MDPSVIYAHRAPDPAPVDEPVPEQGPEHPVPQEDPVPDHNPSVFKESD